MRLLDSVWRAAKLGLFVGWGTALTILAACSSATVKPDTHQGDVKRPADAGAADRPIADGPRPDVRRAEARAEDQRAADRRGWDVPLE